MRTDHRTPLRDTQYQFAGEVDWQEPRWPVWVRITVIAFGSGVCWAAVIALVVMIAAVRG